MGRYAVQCCRGSTCAMVYKIIVAIAVLAMIGGSAHQLTVHDEFVENDAVVPEDAHDGLFETDAVVPEAEEEVLFQDEFLSRFNRGRGAIPAFDEVDAAHGSALGSVRRHGVMAEVNAAHGSALGSVRRHAVMAEVNAAHGSALGSVRHHAVMAEYGSLVKQVKEDQAIKVDDARLKLPLPRSFIFHP